jgi:hypothetical protein
MSITLNQNLAMCIVRQTDFGGTTIHNICTGATTVVPWGSFDWTMALFFGAAASVLLLLLLGMARDCFR